MQLVTERVDKLCWAAGLGHHQNGFAEIRIGKAQTVIQTVMRKIVVGSPRLSCINIKIMKFLHYHIDPILGHGKEAVNLVVPLRDAYIYPYHGTTAFLPNLLGIPKSKRPHSSG